MLNLDQAKLHTLEMKAIEMAELEYLERRKKQYLEQMLGGEVKPEIEMPKVEAKDENETYLTVIEVANLYGLNRQSIYKRVSKGDLTKFEDGTIALSEARQVFGKPNSEDIKSTKIYGIAVRVSRDGSRVEAYTNNEWKERNVNWVKDKPNANPHFWVPNRNLMVMGNSTQVTVPLCRAILQAHIGMPNYIEDAILKYGEGVLLKMKLVEHKDGNKKNVSLANLKWVKERDFLSALAKKVKDE